MIVRFAIICLVVYVAFRLVRRVFAGRAPDRVARKDVGRIDDVMVKDPQCGSYFPLRHGIALKTGDRELHFCSQECRDLYVHSRHPET